MKAGPLTVAFRPAEEKDAVTYIFPAFVFQNVLQKMTVKTH